MMLTVTEILDTWALAVTSTGAPTRDQPQSLSRDRTTWIPDAIRDLAVWVERTPGFASARPILVRVHVQHVFAYYLGDLDDGEQKRYEQFRAAIRARWQTSPWRAPSSVCEVGHHESAMAAAAAATHACEARHAGEIRTL